jgi:hypothetical protein
MSKTHKKHSLKSFLLLLLFTLSLFNSANCEPFELEENATDELPQGPLFISLGSYCEPAHMLRFCNLRKKAFPFDWVISFSGESLIEILNDDFTHFLNDAFFLSYGPAGHLLHSYYHLEFLHEGNFNGGQFIPLIEKLKPKYQRRIERFRQLSQYKEKVFFIRSAYQYSTTDPHRYFKFEDNIEISDEYSLRLYNALVKRFPHLNFSLIIINSHNNDSIEEEKKLLPNLIKFRANPNQDNQLKIDAYKKFFEKLSL